MAGTQDAALPTKIEKQRGQTPQTTVRISEFDPVFCLFAANGYESVCLSLCLSLCDLPWVCEAVGREWKQRCGGAATFRRRVPVFCERDLCACVCFFSVCFFQPEDAKRSSWRGDEGGRSRKEILFVCLFVCLFSLRMVVFLSKLKT